jgi:hypothetical protein
MDNIKLSNTLLSHGPSKVVKQLVKSRTLKLLNNLLDTHKLSNNLSCFGLSKAVKQLVKSRTL